MAGAKERAAAVRLLVLDADGTLTDGGIYTGGDGELFKRFDIKDGMGIALWHKVGGKTAVITGRTSDSLAARVKELGIADLWQGCLDKRAAWEVLKARYGMTEAEIAAYVATGEPMGKAGAYAIQGRAAIYIEEIRGSFSNVVGLPLHAVTARARMAGIVMEDGNEPA